MLRRGTFLLAMAASVAGMASLAAATTITFGNFEDATMDGFGYLSSSSGVKPFPASPGPVASILTPGSGGDTTNVLDLNGAGYNGGQSGGNDLGFDFASNGLASTFLADDILTFSWEVPVSNTSSGYSQLYSIVLNAPGAGYTTVGGSGGGTSPLAVTTGPVNQYPGYSGQVNTVSINYDAYKALISASPSYIQFGVTTNNGGGAPSDIYFDNFQLSQTIPEPTSLGLLTLVGAGMLGRRRRA
jgi:hypothetical protein